MSWKVFVSLLFPGITARACAQQQKQAGCILLMVVHMHANVSQFKSVNFGFCRKSDLQQHFVTMQAQQ